MSKHNYDLVYNVKGFSAVVDAIFEKVEPWDGDDNDIYYEKLYDLLDKEDIYTGEPQDFMEEGDSGKIEYCVHDDYIYARDL